MLPLVQRCVEEHDALIEAAGLQGPGAGQRLDRGVPRPALFEQAKPMPGPGRYGLKYEFLDRGQLQAREQGLDATVVGGIHWLDPKTVSNPGGLTRGYAALFVQRGGQFLHGDAAACARPRAAGRSTASAARSPPTKWWPASARSQPTCSAAWATRSAGDQARLPHALQHPRRRATAALDLRHPGRLRTGADGPRRAPDHRHRVRRQPARPATDPAGPLRSLARKLFPALGERLDDTPWLGRRPCLPDMRPVIGPAPRHPGLWFNFGHAHHGLTLGPVSGRLLAELITGERPFTDPRPTARPVSTEPTRENNK
jgi:D-amino-acid dehydrogenase